SPAEIASLGGPAAEGIFVRRLGIRRNGNSVVLTWRGAPTVALQRATSLTLADWQTIAGTLRPNTHTQTNASPRFYHLIGPSSRPRRADRVAAGMGGQRQRLLRPSQIGWRGDVQPSAAVIAQRRVRSPFCTPPWSSRADQRLRNGSRALDRARQPSRWV